MPNERSRTTSYDPHPVWRGIVTLPRGVYRFIRSTFLSWHTLEEARELTKRIREGIAHDGDTRRPRGTGSALWRVMAIALGLALALLLGSRLVGDSSDQMCPQGANYCATP